MAISYDIVVPVIGRSSPARLLAALSAGAGPLPQRLVLVDERPGDVDALSLDGLQGEIAGRVQVIGARGRGPAAARNAGWRACASEWIVFLDDDVVPGVDWRSALVSDLMHLSPATAASRGHIDRPPAGESSPIDRRRNDAGLEPADRATGDMAYRRSVLDEVDGFDERFATSHRADVDLGLRAVARGYDVLPGKRRVRHATRRADPWVSVRMQRANSDDALMRRLHGRAWRVRADAPDSRLRRQVATTFCAMGAAVLPGPAGKLAAATWAGLTAEPAWRRAAPRPRTPGQLATTAATSAVIPFAATWYRVRGEMRWRGRRVLEGAR